MALAPAKASAKANSLDFSAVFIVNLLKCLRFDGGLATVSLRRFRSDFRGIVMALAGVLTPA
jgi:hypothetical protein